MKRTGVPLFALVLGAVCLRVELVSVGPLLPRIQESLGVSHGEVSLIMTVPVIAMGLFAPLGMMLGNRIGVRSGLVWSLGAIAFFGFARLVVPNFFVVIALSLPIGIAMACASALLPSAVKEWFAHRTLSATSGYSWGMQAGAAVTSLIAVPLAVLLGGWQLSLAAITMVALGSFTVWTLATPKRAEVHSSEAPPQPRSMPLTSGLAWMIVAAFALLGMCFWGVSSWLTGALIERGWDETLAATATAMLNVAAVAGNGMVFLIARRLTSRRIHMMLATGFIWTGVVMLAILPNFALVWATMVGFGNGFIFPALLTLPLDVADEPRAIGAMSAMMLFFGYGLSGLSPFILGAARDLTGSFDAALWIAVIFATGLMVAVANLSKTRLARGIPAGRLSTAGEREVLSNIQIKEREQ